ncbi:Multidrug resistance protein MdtA [Patescibacteria group bacterium]|nr:Multidrug resistance protein MdtA [Patescibacteria group bacterium]
MIKRLIIMLMIVGIILGGIFGFIAFKGKMIKQYMASMANTPQTVSTITASVDEWQPMQNTIATLTASQGVNVSSEVAGMVEHIYFHEGEDIEANTPLVQLKADDDIAKLKAMKAEADLARSTYQRDQAQFLAKAVSQQTLDTDKPNLSKLNAAVAEQQALLDKKLIRAPFSGRLGIRMINKGQYLNAGTEIVNLQALDTLFVDFFLPQQQLANIRIGQTIKFHVDAYPNQDFTGKISVINSKVDEKTRNVLIRAVLNNEKHQLLSGMYASISIANSEAQRWITLPNAAISFNSFGSTVFVIEKDKDQLIAKQVFVTTGDTRGDQVAVLKGIKEGDTVVTSGQIKLHNGSLVKINNTLQPNNNANVQVHE